MLRTVGGPYCQRGVKKLGILVEREQIKITVSLNICHVPGAVLPAGFLILGTVDIWGQIILVEDCPVHCRMFSSIPAWLVPIRYQ